MPNYEGLKKTLQGLVDKKRKDKDEEDNIRRTKNDEDRTKILEGIGKDVSGELSKQLPSVLSEAIKGSKLSKEDLIEALSGASINIPPIEVPTPQVNVNVPEVKIPDIKIPEIKIPTINVPEQKVVFPSKFKLDDDRPIAVILTDTKGQKYNISQFMSGGGGGKQVKQYNEADTSALITGLAMMAEKDNTLLPIQLGSGISDRALRVAMATDSVVSVSGTFSSTPYGTYFASDTVGSVNIVQSIPLDINQISGSVWSVNVTESTGSQGVTVLNGEGLARDSWLISDITKSTKAVIINPDGLPYSGDNPVPVTGSFSTTPYGTYYASEAVGSVNMIQAGGADLSKGLNETDNGVLRVAQMTDVVSSVNVVNSSLIVNQLSGSVNSVSVKNSSLETKQVSGSSASVEVKNSSLEVKQVSGSSDSVAVQGISRTTNPSATGDGSVVDASYDDLGRSLIRPIQIRDLIATAYVAASTGTETTLLAASVGVYHDLIYILASNNSTVAIGLDLRAVTAGNIQMHLEIPANGVTGVSLPVPLPGMLTDGSGNNWTIDLPDVTGTTVYVSALFSKEL